MIRSSLRWLRTSTLLVVGYLLLAVVISWPLVLQLQEGLLGTPTMDQVDTAWLRLAAARWLTGQDPGIFVPLGYPLASVVPNWVDHIIGAPLALLLPWPLADNLFWLFLIAANGLAGHHLGRQLGGSHGAGLLCGVGFAIAEPVLREINASHAPQALLLWSPLFLAALLRALGARGRKRDALLAGLFFALSSLTYWYQGLFLAMLAAPVLVYESNRAQHEGRLKPLAWRLALAAAVAGVLCGPLLAMSMSSAPELAGLGELARVPGAQQLGVPPEHAWTFLHGSDIGWLWRAEPIATASRLSPVLLLAALVGGLRAKQGRWPWVVAALLGGLLLMGPYLQWDGEPVIASGRLQPLPGLLLAEVSDAVARLHWPQRWAVIVPLALLPLVARVPRPTLWAVVLLVETVLLSGNAPLTVSPVDSFAGWSALRHSNGPVLVLPQERQADGPSTMGLVFRACRAPLANELGIPPRAAQPLAFRNWHESLSLRRWYRDLRGVGQPGAAPPGIEDQLLIQGIGAVALDVTPGGVLPPRKSAELVTALSRVLGEPVDYGPAIVWWIAEPRIRPEPMPDAQAWRLERHEALVAEGWQRGRP